MAVRVPKNSDVLRNENSKEDYYYILKDAVYFSDIIKLLTANSINELRNRNWWLVINYSRIRRFRDFKLLLNKTRKIKKI